MKRVLYAMPVVALFATVAYSQAPGGQMQGQKIGLATSLQRGYNGHQDELHRSGREDAGSRLHLQAGLDA